MQHQQQVRKQQEQVPVQRLEQEQVRVLQQAFGRKRSEKEQSGRQQEQSVSFHFP